MIKPSTVIALALFAGLGAVATRHARADDRTATTVTTEQTEQSVYLGTDSARTVGPVRFCVATAAGVCDPKGTHVLVENLTNRAVSWTSKALGQTDVATLRPKQRLVRALPAAREALYDFRSMWSEFSKTTR